MDREEMRKKLAEQRVVEDHWLNGGEVQRKPRRGTSNGCWEDEDEDGPRWMWHTIEYRIKPKPIERWGVVNDLGAVLDTFKTREMAQTAIDECCGCYRIILLREVTE